MKVLVCVKQVLLLDGDVAFLGDGREVDPRCLDADLNDWDQFAIEEALRLREAHGGEVIAATYGPSDADTVLRRALALGVNRVVRVDGAKDDPYTVGEGLCRFAQRLQPDLILCGAQSSDSAHAATGAVIAGLLDLPCVAVVTSVQIGLPEQCADVSRELEGGLADRLRVSLPAVLTVQTGINEPRHPNLRAIKLAEREAIEVFAGTQIDPAYRVRRMFVPASNSQAKPLGADVREAAKSLARIIKERSG